MVKKSAKEEVQEAVEAVENAKEELQEAVEAIEASAGTEATQAEKPTKEKPTKNNELAVRILAVMKTMQKNGIMEVTSSVMKDKLNTKNRGVIRRTMKVLETEGKVIISEKKLGKRRRFSYKLA